jgi:hypothetical protein
MSRARCKILPNEKARALRSQPRALDNTCFGGAVVAHRTCSIEGCETAVNSRGWCSKHYWRWRKYGDPHKVRFIHNDDPARFWDSVDKSAGPDGCWPWQRGRNNKGYGRFLIERDGTRQRPLAHRVAMRLHLGRELDRAEFVLHHCDNPPCCNPAHLFLGTQKDNMADMMAKGRHDHSGLELGWRRGARELA